MKRLAWVTNGLAAVSAALSTAPPDMWGDVRVIGLAVSAFAIAVGQLST